MAWVWKCSTMMPTSGIVPASSTPTVLAIGQRTLTARLAVNSRYTKYTQPCTTAIQPSESSLKPYFITIS